ncbi:hypothetical protein ACDQ55_02830 [Chitinophaga sp. 30R24]|uniref:hypothetical protein n=1 Tax=Chitinophaga sp. 30R24 TaxID=3248838 RepID=UPI003B8F7D71
MKKIAIVLVLAGVILAILAQYALTNDWMWFRIFHTLGFIGYIFIISGLASFSLWLIQLFSREEKTGIEGYYQQQEDDAEANTAQR